MTNPFTVVAAEDPSAHSLILAAVISAVVAALVSFGRDWIAIPPLDARKERILEEHRARRRLHAIARDVTERRERRVVLGEKHVPIPSYKDEVISLLPLAKRPRTKQNRRAYQLILDFLTGATTYRQDTFDWEYLDNAVALLDTPLWRVRRRRAAIAQLNRIDQRIEEWRQHDRDLDANAAATDEPGSPGDAAS